MAEQRFLTHEAIVDHLDLTDGDVVLDLGCGSGHTLVTAARRGLSVRLLGLDSDDEALGTARSRLDEVGAACHLVKADLSRPLPLRSETVTKVVCHDVLEWLPDPAALLLEARRVMRPGALSVWSHTDYDTAVVNGADRELTRRIVHAYADVTPSGAVTSDGQFGRKLPGLMGRSPFAVVRVDSFVLMRTELTGPARFRVQDMASVVRSAAAAGQVAIAPEEVDAWLSSLEAANAGGEFFYAQTAYMVTAQRE